MYVPLDVTRLVILGTKKKSESEGSSPSRMSRSVSAMSTKSQVALEISILTRRVLTVMYMDIAGFTTICENVGSEMLIRILHQYFDAMCGIIIGSKGTLDKVVMT